MRPIPMKASAWREQRLNASWSGVDVDVVEVVPQPGGGRVRAVVRLGTLAPADVQVELRRADVAGSRDACRPMWSAQSYDNGCYVFESSLARDDGAADGDWIVRVRPREALPAPDVQRRVHLHRPSERQTREAPWNR